jgi:hypothetical protein
MCAIVLNEADVPESFKETRTETVIKKSDAIKYFRETQQDVSGLKFHQGEHIRIN